MSLGDDIRSSLALPSVVFDHVCQLYDVLALFVLLRLLERLLLHIGRFLVRVIALLQTHIFPAECILAAVAVYVSHSMQAGQQHALLRRATFDVDTERNVIDTVLDSSPPSFSNVLFFTRLLKTVEEVQTVLPNA